jgi:sugar (pentulose or hexulose) kinase
MVRRVETIQPDADGAATYEALYPSFREIYPALRPTFRELARFEGG